MGYGNCVLANDVPEHHEVLQDAGLYFHTRDEQNLVDQLQHLLDHPEVVQHYRRRVKEHVHRHYSWDKVTRDYEALFYRVTHLKQKAT
ncbi:MAG TPA: glycosyltransferase, partial [bacterium]|nr:glycosyltransferase [bacterium]